MNKKFRSSLPLIGLILFLAACQTAQPTTTAPSTVPISYQNISFDLPLDLSSSASPSSSTDVEFPYIYQDGSMTEHTVFGFASYPVQGPGKAKVMVFPASEYAAYSELLQGVVSALSTGQDTSQPLPRALVQGEFYAQAKPLAFQNGHGVRYLTQVLTDASPVHNEGLFYYYQGITTDNKYFVSAVFPVNADFLVANGRPDAVTPADGVAFDWNASPLDFPSYLSAVTQKLNDATAEAFTPSLQTLDGLIQSIRVSKP